MVDWNGTNVARVAVIALLVVAVGSALGYWLWSRLRRRWPASHPLNPEQGTKSNVISCIANLSIQYNLSAAAIALEFMDSYRDDKVPSSPKPGDPTESDYPPPGWVSYVLLGTVFAGTVVGMCVMGYLGDVLGRRMAMLVTMALTVAGSLGSALFAWGDTQAVYSIICACRFILGMGVGGKYPLSAVTSAESSVQGEHTSSRVAWAFFWQTPGSMAPYAVALMLYLLPHASWITSLQFRLLFAIGSIPALVVFFAELNKKESEVFQRQRVASPLREALAHPQYFRTLIGTGGSWFLYDISYYGTAIFTPDILKAIFGSSDDLVAISWQSLAVTSLGLPGAITAILLLKPRGAKWLSTWGFFLIALCFAALALVFEKSHAGENNHLKFGLFCLVTFSLNFGPNVSTFVLPATCYPANVRSTFHGLSAALGKIGAVVGTFMYAPIEDKMGIAAVLWVQVGLSLLGMLLSYVCLRDDRPSKEPSPPEDTARLINQ
eukprot:m.185883 g.185883  ORF g.185883 m.185883 type:complete len:492 (-) comp18125_c1_seq3:85-1560(-)